MGYEREHAPGTPSWADLASPDLVVSARFYGGLFGWETAPRGPAYMTGGYLVFRLGGRDVAGLFPLVGDDPPAWTLHMALADADEADATVVRSGGATWLAPHDVADAGRGALFADPTGAVFGGWQSGTHRGAELVGAIGSLCWAQLASRNIEAAKRFYGALFGWRSFTVPYETSTYTRFELDGHEVAGMVEMDRSWPRDLPSHWLPYFAVDDCDVVADLAAELGGDVPVEPYDLPGIGRAAVLGDPHGAVFSVMAREPSFPGLLSPDVAATRDPLDLNAATREPLELNNTTREPLALNNATRDPLDLNAASRDRLELSAGEDEVDEDVPADDTGGREVRTPGSLAEGAESRRAR